MKFSHGCSKWTCLIAFIFTMPSFAQSLEDLENEVLNGKSSTSPSAPSPVVEEEVRGSSANSSDADDTDIPLTPSRSGKDADAKVYKDVDDFISGPKSIPFKHIFVVKHQYIFQSGRHEIIPFRHWRSNPAIAFASSCPWVEVMCIT